MHTLPSRMDGVIAHVCGSSAFRLAASGKVQKSDDVLLMRRLITTASLFGYKLLLRFGCVSGLPMGGAGYKTSKRSVRQNRKRLNWLVSDHNIVQSGLASNWELNRMRDRGAGVKSVTQ
jgi:hypothetical protein